VRPPGVLRHRAHVRVNVATPEALQPLPEVFPHVRDEALRRRERRAADAARDLAVTPRGVDDPLQRLDGVHAEVSGTTADLWMTHKANLVLRSDLVDDAIR